MGEIVRSRLQRDAEHRSVLTDDSGVGSRGLGDVWNLGAEGVDDDSQWRCC